MEKTITVDFEIVSFLWVNFAKNQKIKILTLLVLEKITIPTTHVSEKILLSEWRAFYVLLNEQKYVQERNSKRPTIYAKNYHHPFRMIASNLIGVHRGILNLSISSYSRCTQRQFKENFC